MDIPEYYKKYQYPSPEKKDKSEPKYSITNQNTHAVETVPAQLFTANTFTVMKPEDWEDKTIYTLTGPVENGIQHNVIITVEENSPFDSLLDYADWNIHTLDMELKSCRLLKKDKVTLFNGLSAYEAIFSWYPTDDLRIYQQQIYILTDGTGYKLTASFTKKTRQTMGPKVERMMLSFNPVKAQDYQI